MSRRRHTPDPVVERRRALIAQWVGLSLLVLVTGALVLRALRVG